MDKWWLMVSEVELVEPLKLFYHVSRLAIDLSSWCIISVGECQSIRIAVSDRLTSAGFRSYPCDAMSDPQL